MRQNIFTVTACPYTIFKVHAKESAMKNNNKISDTRKMLRTAIPVIGALFLFLISAGYIAYRMVSNYNYNERWKDYDECGLG